MGRWQSTRVSESEVVNISRVGFELCQRCVNATIAIYSLKIAKSGVSTER